MRRATLNYTPPSRPELEDRKVPAAKRKLLSVWYSVFDLLRRPAYSVPLLLNLSGSVWFFVIVGQAGRFRYSLETKISSSNIDRIESHGTHYQFACIPIHSRG
jgi:hypothetical protein